MRELYPTLVAFAAGLADAAGSGQCTARVVIGIPDLAAQRSHAGDRGEGLRPLQENCGLDVEIVSLGDGVKVYRALLAGNLDLD